MSEWMIYGANGYTGELIAREAVKRGLKPVLAGRARDKLQPLATELKLNLRVFDLDDAAAVAGHLQGMQLVLLVAGPFSATSAVMVEACLMARTHYLDITGEIQVFEQILTQAQRAQAAGVVLCPGVGFDVIPTDCVAAALKAALPDAVELALGFEAPMGLSPGTSKTMIEGLGQGGWVRRDGRLTAVPLASSVRTIDFGRGPRLAMSVPWGDVSTAYYSTGIPNIAVYFPTTRGQVWGARFLNLLRPLLRRPVVQRWAQRWVAARVRGPNEQQRNRSQAYVWGEAVNSAGQRRTAWLKTDNGYNLTITGSLAVVQHLLNQPVAAGAYTPSRLMGVAWLSRLPRTGSIDIR